MNSRPRHLFFSFCIPVGIESRHVNRWIARMYRITILILHVISSKIYVSSHNE